MPAALMYRTSSLRISPALPLWPRLPRFSTFAARRYSLTPRRNPHSRFQPLEDDVFSQVAHLRVSSRLSEEGSQASNARTTKNGGALNRFSKAAGGGRRLSQSQEKDSIQNAPKHRPRSQPSGDHDQSHWNKKTFKSRAPDRQHPLPFPGRRPYKGNFISWNRVHRSDKRAVQHAALGKEDASLEPWSQVARLRGMHSQWGYIRHQYSPSEVLSARRAFSSWKTKFGNVLSPHTPESWPWRDDATWLFELDCVPAMRNAWEALEVEVRRETWPLIILSTLHRCPDKAHMVLEATLDPLPQGYAIHDVLAFVAQRLQLDNIKGLRERTIKAEEILELLTKVLEDTPAGHVPFSQRSFGLFARKLPSDQASELYTIVQRSNIRLHPNTQLQFASKLASDMAHKETAYEILKGLAEGGIDLNAPSPSSAITSLLHCRATHDGWSEQKQSFSPNHALEFFMEKGFSPNTINSTAFLDSLCQQAEVDEAIRLSLLFAESGVQLDSKAWATVFRGAKSSLKVENVVKSFDVAKASNAPYVDVLNNALHSIFYFSEMESRESRMWAPWVLPLFGPMLRIYAKKFDLEPLQWWLPDSLPLILTQTTGNDGEKFDSHRPRRWETLETIVPVVENFFSSPNDGPRLRPNTTTVAIMLRAYIKSLQQPYDLMAFYTFFKSRLEERGSQDDLAAQLIKDQGSLIHDTIIMAMTERRGLSRPALQVFGDMLKDHLQRSIPGSSEAGTDDSSQAGAPAPVHPPPGLCTFSILVRGLMNRGDRILAEQVVQVMREQGIEPNLVTWNTLTKGYATMQNMAKTVATLQDMEAAGLKPDLFTFKAFGKLRNQAKALEMMESIIDVNRQKMVGEDLYE